MGKGSSDQSSKTLICLIVYHSNSTNKYSEVEMKKMLEFLIQNIFVVVGNHTGFPTDCWDSHGYELCPYVSRPVFVFI
jgi:predicted nucleic acid binding AN1-type Zn finger protein